MFDLASLMLAMAAATQPGIADRTTCASSYDAMGSVVETAQIALYASRRRPLVMVSVGGQPYAPFAFDTGSSGNLVSLQLAEELGLAENGPSPSVDGNGVPVPGYDTCLNDMVIGGVPASDRRATAFPFDRVDEEGIISTMLFSGSIVKLDGPERLLSIMPKNTDLSALGAPRPWAGELGNAHPVLDVQIAGMNLEVRLDSGSDADLILPLAWMDKLPLKSQPSVVGTMQSASTETEIYGAYLEGSLVVGADTYEDAYIVFAETRTPLLGWPMMSVMTLYMDPEARLTWFD